MERVSIASHFAPKSTLTGLAKFVANCFETRRQRRQLAKLGPQALTDLGLSEKEAKAEANRPIWDVPANWRC